MMFPGQAGAVESFVEQRDLYEVRTFSGTGQQGVTNGPVNEALFDHPSSIVQLPDGSLLITDAGNHVIRRIANGTVSIFSGKMVEVVNGEVIGGYLDGGIDEAFFEEPTGMTVTASGDLLLADRNNHAIRKISKDGKVTTIAGNGVFGHVDGTAEEALFYFPSDVVVDAKGNVYVADTLNHAIRKIDSNGRVSTVNALSSNVIEYYPGAVTEAGDFKDGKIDEALFNSPTALALDKKGNLYVSDTGNQRIRYIDFQDKSVSTVAGGGDLEIGELYVQGDFKDGKALDARFSSPSGIFLTDSGALLIADTNNHVIRMLNDGVVTTIIGLTDDHGFENGVMSSAKLNKPTDVMVSADGKVLVVDTGNHAVRTVQKYEVEQGAVQGPFQIFIDGRHLQVPVAVQQDRTYVQLRTLMEHFGYDVTYDADNHQAIVKINEAFSLTVAPNEQLLRVDNGTTVQSIEMNTIMEQDRMYVPIRFVANALNYDVQWDAETTRVIIRSKIFK